MDLNWDRHRLWPSSSMSIELSVILLEYLPENRFKSTFLNGSGIPGNFSTSLGMKRWMAEGSNALMQDDC